MSLFRRVPQAQHRSDSFEGLSLSEKIEAQRLLSKWLKRRPWAAWRYPILIGRARVLARMSAEERRTLGRRLQAIHGGQAVQRRYRQLGRDTITRARRIGLLKRQQRELAAEGEARRKQLGLPPPPRHKLLPLD